MKKNIITLFLLASLFSNYSLAQQIDTLKNETEQDESNSSDFILGADVVSRYIWRGLDLGSDPAVQPYFLWNKGGFSLGTWGSYGLNGKFAEADLMISYNYKFVTIGITDFFFPIEGFNVNNDYFNYQSGETGHAIEGSLKLSGPDKIPVSFLVGTVFYGADIDSAQNNKYSTYMELSYPVSTKKIDLQFFIGAVVNDIPNLYADGAGIINLGFKATKQLKISDKYSMGAFFSLVINPKYENLHLIFGLNF